MRYKEKIYLQAYPHPTAGLVFNQGKSVEKGIRGYRSGGKGGKLVLKKLIENFGEEEGKDIYVKYNKTLLDIATGFGSKNTGCIVLYIPEDL